MGLENPVHLAILALIILLIFGAKRLPEIGRSLGSGMREFKGAITGGDDKADAEAPAPAPPAATAESPPAQPQQPKSTPEAR